MNKLPEKIAQELTGLDKAMQEIKGRILNKICILQENKESHPVVREVVRIIIRPKGSALTSKLDINFQHIDRHFDPMIRPVLDRLAERYPYTPVIMEFLLYPYELGGKKLIENHLIQSLKPSPKTEKAVVMPSIRSAVIETHLAATEMAMPITETPDITDTRPIEVEEKQSLPEPIEQFEETPTQSRENLDVKTPELNIAPFNELSEEFLNQAIDFSWREWVVYPTSNINRRLQHSLTSKGLNTPRKLLDLLGSSTPSMKQWVEFIDKLNSGTTRRTQNIGGNCSYELRKWMIKKGLIDAEFRTR